MHNTKIVATLGPAFNNRRIIRELFEAGVDVVRLNFSHGTREEHGKIIELVREVEKESGKTVGIMMDTRGPEIRTGRIKEESVELQAGDSFTLTTCDINGDCSQISVSYKGLPGDLTAGSRLLIDDGLLELRVKEIVDDQIHCKVITGGILSSSKGINIPGTSLDLPAITEKDSKDIEFGLKKGIDFIAVSFVRKAADILAIRKLIREENNGKAYIIAKIENQEGVNNIGEILEVADGIMIARGDLGVEIPPEKVPVIQKNLIRKCNQKAKPVITATQMLESMIRNPRPTRAEASDVANAIYDGSDAIMLSGETAAGIYPVQAVKTMVQIAEEIEASDSYQEKARSIKTPVAKTITEAISSASCKTAMDLNAHCIITATTSGYTARMVSKHRPMLPVIGATHSSDVKHFLSLVWGVYPLQVAESKNTDEMIDNSISAALEQAIIQRGELVIITAGVPVSMSGATNLIEVLEI
ncbi:MAG TPA: pyruvate kinase [Halanaerobiales bacterium]|nr:pyruvate kinase [Halanaerobiales bacterium]